MSTKGDIQWLKSRIEALEASVFCVPKEKKDHYAITVGNIVRDRHYDTLLRVVSVEGDMVYLEEC